MDLLLWLSDPMRYEADIEAAYLGLLYSFADFLSYQLTINGYPPVG